jgi:hypothetical protein
MGKPKQPEPPPQPIMLDEETEDTGGGGGGGGSTYGSSTRSWESGAPISFGGFQDFAKTGGFSAADLANIRARAVSPVRAAYARAQEGVNRQRALQGGYSPGFGVLQARMARQQGQSASDAATNAEAAIAEMVQQGKLAGLQGMAGTEARSSTSDTSGYSSGGGGGGGGRGAKTAAGALPSALLPEKKKGFWGKLGSGLKKVGQIALPIAAGAFTGGLAAPLTAGLTGAGQKVGQSLLPKSWQSAGGG